MSTLAFTRPAGLDPTPLLPPNLGRSRMGGRWVVELSAVLSAKEQADYTARLEHVGCTDVLWGAVAADDVDGYIARVKVEAEAAGAAAKAAAPAK